MLIWIIVIAAAVLLDQVSKILVVEFLNREEPLVLIEGVFRFTYVENDGAAFGMLGDHRWIFMILSVVGIAAVFVYLWKFRPNSKFACTALSFIVGGGIGNMIDRIFRYGVDAEGEVYHYVVDFIDFYAFPDIWMWVFNIADSFVCVGAGMMIVYLILDLVKEYKKEKADKAAAEAPRAETADGVSDGDGKDE
ncbi:MAG: signal peptidase II [Clostridia bacterium]|nr:signal peptidase II [Clostridia bacterium]